MAARSRVVGFRGADATADRLHSAAIGLLRRLRRADERLGVSPARLSVLSILVFGGPRSTGALARAEQVSAPTMTRLIQRLEAEGLVETRRDEADRRVIHVSATAAGTKLLRRGRRARVRQLARWIERLPAGERETLDRAARMIGAMLSSPRAA
jgi:DNA-binding MarR family transcriptional regulator